MKTISNQIIRSFKPCYDPSKKNIPDNEELTVVEWVEKYRSTVPAEDIIWLMCRNKFLSDRDLRLFAVWCAREALKLIDEPDPRSVESCNVSERFANGGATREELTAARDAARAARDAAWEAAGEAASAAASAAARDAARDAARVAARAAWVAVWVAAGDAAWVAARDAQLNKLLTYFV